LKVAGPLYPTHMSAGQGQKGRRTALSRPMPTSRPNGIIIPNKSKYGAFVGPNFQSILQPLDVLYLVGFREMSQIL